ncbi:MAG: metallophosphoesterase family protein [Planctomycetota bacterium]|jgi:Icc-related predicted phosphoesterase
MRILFLSDFHGHMPDLSGWEMDLVVAGGDYCEVDEIRLLKFEAMKRGRHATDWVELAGRAHAEELVDRALAEGSAVVAALADCGVPVLAIPGNSDRAGMYFPELIERHSPRADRPQVDGRMTDIETRLVVHEGVAFAGLGGWSGPSDPERIAGEVARLDQQRHSEIAGDEVPLVLVSHNVPYGSSLDGVNNPELPDFAQGRLVGSHRCIAAIKRLSPVLCLSGHMHENYGKVETVDGALCLCGAGAYRGEGVLLDIHPDGTVGTPEFVTSTHGATRVLA